MNKSTFPIGSKRQLAHNIWQTVFEDNESFASLYFDEIYTDRDTFLLTNQEGNLATVHLQALPYQWKGGEYMYSAGYIAGVATLPEYRGRGWASLLMQKAHTALIQRGHLLSFLLPASASLYRFYANKYGYTQTSLSLKSALCSEQERSKWHPIEDLDELDAYKRFTRYEEKLSSICQLPLHSLRQWRMIRADLELAGGGVYTDGGTDYYLAPQSNSDEKRSMVIRFSVPHQGSNFSLQSLSQPTPHGMIRILNAPRILSLYPNLLPTHNRFFLIDDHLPHNRGWYVRTQKGQWIQTHRNQIPVASTAPNIISIEKLNQELLSLYPALIFLMLE